MNTVIEESARTRAAQLEKKLQQLYHDLAEVNSKLDVMPERQRQARIDAIGKSPTLFAGKVGSEALKLERDQETLEARRDNLVRELEATNAVYAVEMKRLQKEELRPVIERAVALSASEADAWRSLGELAREWLTLIGKVFDAAEERDQLLLANEAAIEGCDDEVMKAEATAAFQPVVSPMPVDTVGVTMTVLDAVCDPHRTLREEGEVTHLDGADFLVKNLSDLRHLNRVAQLSGRVDKRYSSRQAQDYGFGNLLPALT